MPTLCPPWGPYKVELHDRVIGEIAAFAAERVLRTAMLERWFGNGARHVLLENLAVGNVSAWQGWVRSGFHVVAQTADRYRLTPREDARTNMQYYRAGWLGWHRIGADSDALRSRVPVAFGARGVMSVVVAANRAGTVSEASLPPGNCELIFALDGAGDPEPQMLVVGPGPVEIQMLAPGLMSVAPPWQR